MGVKPNGELETRDAPPLARRAVVASSSAEGERTAEIIWTTGARVLRSTWPDESFYEELSLDPRHVRMDRLRAGAPLLNTHRANDLGDVIGVVEEATLDGKQGKATVRFAKDDPAADAVWRKVQDKIIRNVSVGYRVHRLEKIEEAEGEVPVYLATDWEPYEISVVPMGADAGAGMRNESATTNPCDVVAGGRRKEQAMTTKSSASATRSPDPKDTSNPGDQIPEGEDGEPSEGLPGVGDPGDEATPATGNPSRPVDGERRSLDAARRGERQRIVAINDAARALGVAPAVVKVAIDKGTPADDFRRQAIEIFQREGRIAFDHGPQIEPGEDARDKWMRGASNWLVKRTGLERVVVETAKRNGEAKPDLDPGEFRGMSLVDMARSYLERAGVRTQGMDKLVLVGKALTHRAGGMMTTSDFGNLLEGTLRRSLLGAYATAPDTWREFAAVGSVSDFRPHSRIRVGTLGALDKVNEHGEFRNKSLADATPEEIAAATYGNIIGITRQAIVNDDLGVFTGLSTILGRSAKRSIEIAVYRLLAENSGMGPTMADGYTLFHANHGNVGTGSALSVAGLDADRIKIATQMDQDSNDYLDLRPSVLLLPIGLEGQARVLIDAEYDIDEGDGTTPNRVRGLFPKIIGSPRITGTRRYAFADPADVPTLEVVFLDGKQEPDLEQQEGWRIDGTEWKVRLDFGVGAVDWRGAVTNAGA
jgi:HK97 family phage prohead protease